MSAGLNEIIFKMIITLAILLIVILLVSRSIKYFAIIGITTLSNIAIAFLFYWFFNIEIHLYSLAGISISAIIVINNNILVLEYLKAQRSMRMTLACVGATLTIIAVCFTIFYMDVDMKRNLVDFSLVLIINLFLSIPISLFVIPAVSEAFKFHKKDTFKTIKSRRLLSKINAKHRFAIQHILRFKIVIILFIILLFGLPLFLLPTKIEGSNWFVINYNKIIGGTQYNESIRPFLDVAFGGTIRLFTLDSETTEHAISSGQTEITVNINLLQGSQVEQMNSIASSFENFLSQFNKVDQFQCWVFNGQNALIKVRINKKYGSTDFPVDLKRQLEDKALQFGSAEFQVFGVGDGFNNELEGESTNFAIQLQGYNYERLQAISQKVKNNLEKNPRVSGVLISTQRDISGKESVDEIKFNISDRKKIYAYDQTFSFNEDIKNITEQAFEFGKVEINGTPNDLVLVSSNPLPDFYTILNQPIRIKQDGYVKLNGLIQLSKEKNSPDILRVDQEYQLVVNYNFIGENSLGMIVSKQIIENVKKDLPIGFTVKMADASIWDNVKLKLVSFMLLAILIVLIICSVILNKFKQSIVIILILITSFIGVFLLSYLLKYPFEEGGFLSMILLCGLVVGGPIYFLNEYNNLTSDFPKISKTTIYLKVINSNLGSIVLSRALIILGLCPFMFWSEENKYWASFSLTISAGLLFSIPVLLILMPILLGLERDSILFYNSKKMTQ